MIKILSEPFSKERRMVRQCWNEQDFTPDWYDYLYLMTGRAENKDGSLIRLDRMETGTIFQYDKFTLEKCRSEKETCSRCIGSKAKKHCKNMPLCGTNNYFRPLNLFEIRKLNKQIKKNNDTK